MNTVSFFQTYVRSEVLSSVGLVDYRDMEGMSL
jgi:hypothetical protein